MTDEQVMEKYQFILIDETHERDLQIDLTIYMLKNLLLRNKDNPKCPFVVLMSATFDPQSFLDYFDIPVVDNFIWCRGEAAGFDEMWDWNDGRTVNNYPQSAATVVERICTIDGKDDPPEQADVLIFLPGAAEFRETAQWLNKLNKKLADSNLPVFSMLQIDGPAINANNLDNRRLDIPIDQHIINIDGKKFTPNRRVILSTVVAETGLTLNHLKYVIDAGYNREIEFNPIYGVAALVTKPAPISRIKQRKGRAGRKFKGVFFPLYPKYIYDMLPELQFPQILTSDISDILMDIIYEQLKVKMLAGDTDPLFDLNDIDMVDVPTSDSLLYAFEKLYALGFITLTSPQFVGNQTEHVADMVDVVQHSPADKTQDKTQDISLLVHPQSGKSSIRMGFTRLGVLANTIMVPGMTVEAVRMILGSYGWGANPIDLITIAAYLNIDERGFTEQYAPADSSKPPGGAKPVKQTINWLVIYKVGLPGFFDTATLLYKTRLIISDAFIDGLILFNAVKAIINSAVEPSTELQSWCTNNHISYKTVMVFIKQREDIIEQMLGNSFNIFTPAVRLQDTSRINFMDTITRIKHCIYDGYRQNIMSRNSVGKYITPNGLTVQAPKMFAETEKKRAQDLKYGFVLEAPPRVVIYLRLGMRMNVKSGVYNIMPERVSTMDGFVSVDRGFLI
jgi:hypothetical protein